MDHRKNAILAQAKDIYIPNCCNNCLVLCYIQRTNVESREGIIELRVKCSLWLSNCFKSHGMLDGYKQISPDRHTHIYFTWIERIQVNKSAFARLLACLLIQHLLKSKLQMNFVNGIKQQKSAFASMQNGNVSGIFAFVLVGFVLPRRHYKQYVQRRYIGKYVMWGNSTIYFDLHRKTYTNHLQK